MTTTYTYEIKVNDSSFGSEFFSVEGYVFTHTYRINNAHNPTVYLDRCIIVNNLINPDELSIGTSNPITENIDKAKVMIELYAKVIEVAEEELAKRVKGE